MQSKSGERVPILAGYGATEAGPTICVSYRPCEAPGEIGLPAPGIELKLVPAMDGYEARVRGPNVCPVISDYQKCLRRHSTKRASIG